MYIMGKPVMYTDPSGMIPKLGGIISGAPGAINGNFVYSCNCGWLDLGHANPATPLSINQLMSKKIERNPAEKYKEGLRKIHLGIETPLGGSIAHHIVVNENLYNKKGNILGIYMDLENTREWWQCIVWWKGSCYAEEDLSSDLIGFYMMVDNKGDARYDANTWNWLADTCGFPRDVQKARKWSIDVIGKYGEFTKRKDWNADPVLKSCPSVHYDCNAQSRKWPIQFTGVQPVGSSSETWWRWKGELYEPSYPSNIPGISLLLKYGPLDEIFK